MSDSNVWVSVKDRLPEKDGEYLVSALFDDGAYVRKITRYDQKRRCFSVGFETAHRSCIAISHWAEIPDLPKFRGEEVAICDYCKKPIFKQERYAVVQPTGERLHSRCFWKGGISDCDMY